MHDFVVLEMEPGAGGNARWGESDVCAFPWAAHYVPVPGRAAPLVRELFTDLGLFDGERWDERYLVHAPRERLFIHGRWQEGLEPAVGPTAARSRSVCAVRRTHRTLSRERAVHDTDGSRRRRHGAAGGGLAVDGRVARSRTLRFAVAAMDDRLRLPRRLRRPGGRRLGMGGPALLRRARGRRAGTADLARGQRLDRASSSRTARHARPHRTAHAPDRAPRPRLARRDHGHRVDRRHRHRGGAAPGRDPHRRGRSAARA